VAIYPKNWAFPGFAWKQIPKMLHSLSYRFPKRGCNWGTLRIPREDWGTLGNTYKLKLTWNPEKWAFGSDEYVLFQRG